MHLCPGVQEVDYSQYPDKPYQLKWLRRFLHYQLEQDGRTPTDVTDTDVERLYVQVNKYALVRNKVKVMRSSDGPCPVSP